MMYSKEGVRCGNIACPLHKILFAAEEWNSRPAEGYHESMCTSLVVMYDELLARNNNLGIKNLNLQVENRRLEAIAEMHGGEISGDGSGEALPEVGDPCTTVEAGRETETFSVPLPVGISQETIDMIRDQSNTRPTLWQRFVGMFRRGK